MNDFNYSKNGVQLTESFEGCRLTAYQDVRGVWTIGYGHTGADVYEGLTITQDEASTLLIHDMARAELAVNTYVDAAINQEEFDALVDFVFNAGATAFKNSTMLALLNQGDFQGAAAEFDKWDHAAGQVIAGLLRRRQAETALFEQGISEGETTNNG